MAREDHLLGPLVAHARAGLADLKPGDVPAALDRVMAHTGPRLPPPLAARLLDEIDRNTWLRQRLAESWPHESGDDASGLFLLRPHGWERRYAAAVGAAAEAEAARTIDALGRDLGSARVELAETRRRLKRIQRETDAAIAETEKAALRRVEAVRAQLAEDAQASEDVRRQLDRVRRQLEEGARDLEVSRARVRSLRAELLKARRDRRPERSPTTPSAWSALDAGARAALLDDIGRAFRPPAHLDGGGSLSDVDAPTLALPAGTRPDAGEAIKWLMELDRPYVLVVDGYNVVHLIGTPVDAAIRERLNRDLARIRGLAASPIQVIVVYDSAVAGDVTTSQGPGGIEVRFTAEGHTADDEILLLATQFGSSAVVVSNDRQVREGAERVGALCLWSDALADWIRTA